jgi:hypothetical protein
MTHHCALCELVELEHTHGAVPDDCLALLQGVGELLDAVGANVQTLQAAGAALRHSVQVDADGMPFMQHCC